MIFQSSRLRLVTRSGASEIDTEVKIISATKMVQVSEAYSNTWHCTNSNFL